MGQEVNEGYIKHYTDYIAEWQRHGVTKQAATVNYTRQFPARIPPLLVAFSEKHNEQAPSEV